MAAVPPDVVQARLTAAAQRALLEAAIQPRIDGHLLVYDGVLDALANAHARIANTLDFGLGADTRWAAVWEMSGRCIALSRCAMAQLRAGFASETVPTLRSIHEATRLLSLVRGPGETNLLRRWLRADHIGAQRVRSAVHRIERPIVAQMRAEGINVDANLYELGQQVYEVLSAPAHNTREGFRESVSTPLRTFAYGPHPDPVTRAVHVDYGGELLEEVLLVVGISLGTTFLGPDYFRDEIQPLQQQLHAIRDQMPVDPETVHGMRQAL
jgi:hypothetical protein